MKKLLLVSLLCAIGSIATAQPVTQGYSRGILMNNGYNNYNNQNNLNGVVQCQQLNEGQISSLSKRNMENQICLYETYANITEKWITNPPQQYVPPKSIVITLNKQEVSDREKEQLKQTSEMCQSLALQMREKLKSMYSVNDLACK